MPFPLNPRKKKGGSVVVMVFPVRTMRDESATDFSYAIALLRRGYPDHDIRQRIFG